MTIQNEARTTTREAESDAQDALLDDQVRAAREAAELRNTAASGPRSPLGPGRDPDATEEPDSRVEDDDDDDFIVDDGPAITPRKVDLAANDPREAVADEDDDDEDEDELIGGPNVPPRMPPRPSKPKPVFGV